VRLLICIKQVPDSTTRVKVATDGRSIVTDGVTWSISPYDEYAIELALEHKDTAPDAVVSVVGPLGIADALRAVVEELKPDLVLCGRQASDDDEGFVGPALAEALGWPHVSQVTRLEPDSGQLWKEVEGGHEVWKVSGGAVLTVQKSAKDPRYPSLPGIMKAKKKEIPERSVAGVEDPVKLEIVKLEPPPARGGGKIFKDGDTKAHAAELATLLRDEAKVL